MTKEALEARLKILKDSHDEIFKNLYAHKGAIEECQYWLEELRKEHIDTHPLEVVPEWAKEK